MATETFADVIKNTYWNHAGKYQAASKELELLIPSEGTVQNPRKNPKLEKFRKACNCYADLFNNNLYNRKTEFRAVFGLASSTFMVYRGTGRSFTHDFYKKVEAIMDDIIAAAAEEQGLAHLLATNKETAV